MVTDVIYLSVNKLEGYTSIRFFHKRPKLLSVPFIYMTTFFLAPTSSYFDQKLKYIGVLLFIF